MRKVTRTQFEDEDDDMVREIILKTSCVYACQSNINGSKKDQSLMNYLNYGLHLYDFFFSINQVRVLFIL